MIDAYEQLAQRVDIMVAEEVRSHTDDRHHDSCHFITAGSYYVVVNSKQQQQ